MPAAARVAPVRRIPPMSAADSWLQEREAMFLYGVLADVETAPDRRQLFQNLAHEAGKQATVCETEIRRSGATAGPRAVPRLITLSGVAALLAGAFSMAAGEYVSMRSQREMFERQISVERAELAQYPVEEAAELALIYEARGLPKDDAARVARTIMANPESALDTVAREELGLDPSELGSPWGAALSS